MKLRDFVLSLWGHPKDVSAPFSFETRAICNFVKRRARQMKIETEGFNQIVVHDDPFAQGMTGPRLAAVKSLVVPFAFDKQRYLRSQPTERHIYFAELLRYGIEQADHLHPLPVTELHGCIDEFIDGGCQNRWVHASRTIRERAVVAELHCEMDIDEFRLSLELKRKGQDPIRHLVLTTRPDEICYHYEFKDLELQGNELVITKRSSAGGVLARFDLDSLEALQARA